MTSRPKINGGFAIPAAIFLIVILAALGAYMVSFTSAQHSGLLLDVTGERAWQAANAGMDWSRHQLIEKYRTHLATPTTAVDCAGLDTSFTLSGTETLNDYTVTLTCNSSGQQSVTAYNTDTYVFEIQAVACNYPVGNACPGDVARYGYVERKLSASLSL